MSINTKKTLFKSKASYIFTLIFSFSMGAFLFSIIIFILFKEKKFKINAGQTKGIITNIDKIQRKTRSGLLYDAFIATITYQDLNGKAFTCQTASYKNTSKYNFGEEIKIYYDKRDPSKSILAEKYVFVEIALILTGLFLMLAPIYSFRYKRPLHLYER